MKSDGTRPPKVMLVDDSDLVLETTRAMLEARGCEVICSNTPIGASLIAFRERPDAILLDLEMASMTGAQVASAFKSKGQLRDIPVLIYSAQPEEKLRAAVEACGADGYIQKTSSSDELCSQLARWLKLPRQGVEP